VTALEKQIPRGNDRKKSKGKSKDRSRSLRDDSQKDKGKCSRLLEWRECFFLGRVVADG
jgi:hypothetical protein